MRLDVEAAKSGQMARLTTRRAQGGSRARRVQLVREVATAEDAARAAVMLSLGDR